MVKLYDFGTAPRASSEGYVLVGTVHSTEQDLRSEHSGEDLIFVYGPSVHGQPGVFEFARFERKVANKQDDSPTWVDLNQNAQQNSVLRAFPVETDHKSDDRATNAGLDKTCAAVEADASDSEDQPVREVDFDSQTVAELAKQFVTALRSNVGDDVYKQIVALNKAEKDPSICHSHDFIDANMVMAMAFAAVTGTAVDVRSFGQSLLWSQSWVQAVRDMKQ